MKNTVSHLSDVALVAEVKRLARNAHDATVRLVAHLAEFGARELHLAAGFSSLFDYCREVLALSEGEAYNRTVAARAVRKFPLVLDLLARGSVNLTTVTLLHKHLTAANHEELLEAASGKSKRDVERLLADRFPQPAVPFSVRKMPASVGRVGTAELRAPAVDEISRPHERAESPRLTTPAPVDLGPAVPVPTPAPSHPARPAEIHPTAQDQYSVKFTATAATWEKLQAAQDLLRHALPTGDVSEIFDRALQLLLEDLAKRKFAATTRPRASKGTKPGSRDIPNAVQRSVWVRDCARCAFVSASGRRCTARGRLEFHHRRPYGVGGEATVDNIELRCRAHNNHEARLFYGPLREGSSTVCEAIPEWPLRSRSAVACLSSSDR
jgi:hypothetical protein